MGRVRSSHDSTVSDSPLKQGYQHIEEKNKGTYVMYLRAALSLAVLLTLTLPSLADTTIVDEDFESYNNNTELLSAWPSQSGVDNGLELVDVNTVIPGTDGADFLEVQRTNPAGIPAWQAAYGPDQQKYPGIDGQAAQFCGTLDAATCSPTGAGTVNLWNGNPLIDVYPTATQNVELSFDLGDDALSANKRLTIGLRSLAPVENIIEMGLYNDPTGFVYRDSYSSQAVKVTRTGSVLAMLRKSTILWTPLSIPRKRSVQGFIPTRR